MATSRRRAGRRAPPPRPPPGAMRPGRAQLARTLLLELDLAVLLLALASTGLATLVLPHVAPAAPRPFFLADASLWYARAPRDSVPIAAVFAAGYGALAPAIFLAERRAALARRASPRRARLTAARFALGVLTCTMLAVCLVEHAKTYVGRLRPNFAERCLGAGAAPPAGGGGVARVVGGDEGCVGGRYGAAWDGRRSFPSGHAALGAGLGGYAQLWAARRGGGAAYVAGCAALAAGLGVGASRVVDNAHHPADVVGGAALGLWLAAVHFWRVERETERAEAEEAEEAAGERARMGEGKGA